MKYVAISYISKLDRHLSWQWTNDMHCKLGNTQLLFMTMTSTATSQCDRIICSRSTFMSQHLAYGLQCIGYYNGEKYIFEVAWYYYTKWSVTNRKLGTGTEWSYRSSLSAFHPFMHSSSSWISLGLLPYNRHFLEIKYIISDCFVFFFVLLIILLIFTDKIKIIWWNRFIENLIHLWIE